MGGSFTGVSERQMKEGSGNGVSLSLYGSRERGTWWGDSFTDDPEGYIMEGSGNGHLSAYGPCWGTWRGGAHFPRNFRDRRRSALETKHLPLWEFCKESLEGGLPYWRP